MSHKNPVALLEDLVVVGLRGFDFLGSRLGRRKPVAGSESREQPNGDGPAKAGGNQESKRVLVFEADSPARSLLGNQLREANLSVEFASNVAEALQTVRCFYPDAILMELVKGNIHPTELIKEARRDAKFAKKPIYVYSRDTSAQAPKLLAAGATKIFDKMSVMETEVIAVIVAELEKLEPDSEPAPARPRVQFTTVIVDGSCNLSPRTNALVAAGFMTAAFAEPAEAFNYLEINTTDLVIVNLTTPGAEDFCDKLFELPIHRATPFILITKDSSATIPSNTPAPDSSALLLEPFTPGSLVVRALKLVQKKQISSEFNRAPRQQPAMSTSEPRKEPVAENPLTNTSSSAQSVAALNEDEEEPGFTPITTSEKNANPAATQVGARAVADSCPNSQEFDVEGGSAYKNGGDKADSKFTATVTTSDSALSAGAAVFVLDDMLQIQAAHRACVTMFGATEGQLVGLSLGDLLKYGVSSELTETLSREIPAEQTKEVSSSYLTALRRSREEFPARMIVKQLNRNSRFRWTATFEDLSHNFDHTKANPKKSMQEPTFVLSPKAPPSVAPAHDERYNLPNTGPESRPGSSTQTSDGFRAAMEAAKAKVHEAESALSEQANMCKQLEEELARIRVERDDACQRLASQEQQGAASGERIRDLEERLCDSDAELEKTRAELAAKALQTPAPPADPAPTPKPASNDDGNADIEPRVRELVTSLAQATAELARERGERRRSEQRAATLAAQLQSAHKELSDHLQSDQLDQERIAQLENQFQERGKTIERLEADLQKELAERRLMEESLREGVALGEQAQKDLSLYEEAKRLFNQRQEEQESRLQDVLATLNEAEAKLRNESGQRRQLAELVEEGERKLREQAQNSALERAKLQSSLRTEEMERKRLENELTRFRQVSFDSERSGRLLVNTLRRQSQTAIDALYESACRLLQAELPEEPKRLIQSVLENTLLLKSRFQEVAANPNPAAGADTTFQSRS